MRFDELTKDDYLGLDRDRVVPVLPLGSLEQHGPHLPMGTDTFQVSAIVARAESLVPDTMIVAPPLWVGNSVNHLGFRAAVTLDPTRYVTLLADLGRCLLDQGFRHLLFVNGHGANVAPLVTALHQLESEQVGRREDVQIAGATWWALEPEAIEAVRESPPDAAGHACEIETSLMLHVRPELVRRERIEDGARGHPHPDWGSYDFTGTSRVAFVEMFHRAAPNGVAGLPTLATAAKGAILLERVSDRLAAFVCDFSRW
jgi:creatinine amidohydrolase